MVPSEFQGRNAITVADADATIDDANHIDQSTNDVNHAENHVTHLELFEAVEESVLSCKPLVDFFYHFDKSTKTVDNDSDFDGDDDTCADEGEEKKQKRKNYGRGRHAASVTLSDRRVAICNVVKSVKFNKSRARRLFAGMIPLLNKIFEEESCFTTKSHESESDGSVVDDDGNTSDVNNGDEDCTSDERNGRGNDEHMHEESSSQSILYLRCCAYLMEAYLRGLIERITQKRKSRNKSSNNTTINYQNDHNLQDAIPIIDEAYQVAEILHSALFPLYQLSTADPTKTLSKQSKQTISSIFGVCETYWHGHFEDREQFVTQLIPLLLIKCLDVTAQKADIKRLFSIREALNLLDFEDEESIASLRLHLLRTVSSPLFLQSAEGRKFISHLFQLHPSFVIDLHQAIKVQLPEVKKSILKAYAEIYFTAWKTSCDSRENDSQKDESEDIQTAIEENALQDIMHAGIHAAVPNTAKTVRLVLDQFYTKKKTPAVESMLHRLYGPLLWRALSSSHARVRTQASVVLVDTFPLRDPHAGREATEVCVKKSVAALASLLEDDVPSVRVAGATAASKILSSFWVAIPSKDIQFLLNIIIAKHASDSTSSNVRSSAVIAIQTLLEEEKTHAVLRPLLPSLGNLIHDKTEKVRLAVVKLLLFVKKVRGMKYYHVVPAHHLLVRLEDEGCRGNPTGPVAMALTDLLSNSFFPSSNSKKKAVTMTEIINRTLRLLTDNPGAALVFYRNASSTLSVGSISKLIAALMKCLVMFIEEEKEHRPEDFGEDINNIGTSLKDGVSVEDSKKGNDTNAKLFKEKNNMALMATIAESISALWDSIKNELSQSQNESCDELLKDLFSGNVLTEVYEHFASKFENEEDFEDSMLGDCFRACVAILHCAGKMDEVKIEGLRTRIVKNIASLNSISVEKRSKMNFSPSVSLLCVWGMTENVSQCLGSSITLYFGGDGGEHDVEYCQESKESKKRKSFAKVNAKGKSAQLLPQLDMDVCIGILGHILKGCFPASVSARENILTSETAYSAIEGALGMAQIAAENILKPKVASELKLNVDMIRSIGISLECYGRLALHKEAIKKEIPMSMPPELNALLDWISDVVIPSLVKLSCQDSTLRDLDLSMISGAGSLCSPVSSGPPKRKMNRDSSPLEPRLSNESFISAEASFNFYQEKSSFSLSKATAISAINSVLCTYAEWISFRFVCDSTSIKQVSKWCQVLKNADKTVKRTLLPVFLRLSLVIMKNCGNLDLFHEIIQSIEDVDLTFADEEILETFISTLIELRDDKLLCDVVKSTFSTFCSTVSRIPDSEREKDVEVLEAAGQCIRALVMSMLRDCRSSLMLARFLVENPNSGSKSIYSGKSLRFHVLKKMKEFSPQMQSLTKLLTKLDDENDTANMTEAG